LTATISPANAPEPAAPAAEDLMIRVQHGDSGAYQELVRLYQRKVFRVISGYHRDPEDAMEVVQDTFLKVYTSRQTWERRKSFSAWLYRIAINASIDRYRRNERAQTTSLDDVEEGRARASATLSVPRSPIDRLRDGERRRIVENAVRRLPERQREVLSLRYFADLQLEEIAEALGCPLGTVKSNLHKAVLGLKRMLLEHKEVLSYEGM
jgi:RNA polymerase sigma-70 factor, ECF subfamily